MSNAENVEDGSQAITCKVVLIGESGVGKTSIINRFVNNNFSSVLMSTSGANFSSKTIFLEEENKSINFEIWDTAGQEKYRSLAKVFYKNSAVCVLVYSITDAHSMEGLKNYWKNEIKQEAPDTSKLNHKPTITFYSSCSCWEQIRYGGLYRSRR